MTRHWSHVLRRVAGAAVLVVGVPVVSVGATAGPAVAATATLSFYTNASIVQPVGIVAGSDGALWFTDPATRTIGRLTTSLVFTAFPISAAGFPEGIAAGPDGALWYTNIFPSSIGRTTTSGVSSDFTDASIDRPIQIAAGPDGALWFTNQNSIGRITTTGTVTSFTDPSLDDPRAITAGPDGAMWFGNFGDNSIGRITTAGVITHYSAGSPAAGQPNAITAGPDGALWFTDFDGNSIGRITTAGTVTHFTRAGMSEPAAIAAGPDGNLWFTNYANHSLGRITTAGTISLYTDPRISGSAGITAGPDGAMWFGNYAPGSIGRITPGDPEIVVLPGAASVVEGDSGTANLVVPVTLSTSSTETVTVDWVTGPAGAPPRADPASDFTAASGTVTFAPGETAKSVSISVNGDVLVEPDEWITLSFRNPTNARVGGFYGLGFGIITNDDHAIVLPGSASVVEGNSGTVDLSLPVTLSKPSTQTIAVDWNTGPAGPAPRADPASDFTAASGTVTFAPGEMAKSVTISVNGDVLVEPDEWITVSFKNPTNAKMGGFYGLGFGIITNDD
jgi:streptogramin lyase